MSTKHLQLAFSAAAFLMAASADQGHSAEVAQSGADFIRGVVTGTAGPEAGVWVIAETNDLKTPFTKIVVTDDRGRYVLPELPKAKYKVWARGYGLADSKPAVYGVSAYGTELGW